MARYTVKQRYKSNAYGPWDADTEVELDPAQAAWVNNDSPGTLQPKDSDERKAMESDDRADHARYVEEQQADAASEATPGTATHSTVDASQPTTAAFDPDNHSVDEVKAYLDRDLDDVERKRVVDAERGGQGRKTILEYKPKTAAAEAKADSGSKTAAGSKTSGSR